MRITIFCPSYGALGGIENIAASLAAEFRRCGHAVLVLARQDSGAVQDHDGTPVIRLPFHQFPRRARHVARHLRFARGLLPTVAGFRRALRQWNADVLLALAISTYGPYLLGLAGPTPVIVCLQGGEPGGAFAASPRLFRWVLRRAAGVAACATSLVPSALALAPDIAPRLRVIPNGVEPDRFSAHAVFPHERPYIVAVGRLTRQKGFDVLLDALVQLGKQDCAVDLLIAGDGPEKNPLRFQCDRLGLSDRVQFLGAADETTIAALYRGARFVVCPSRWEGLPLVCLEAMVSGRAVVATAVDGIPDAVLDAETGLLVPPEDPAGLAAAMASLLKSPERSAALGRHGKQRVQERFTWHLIGRQYMEFFAEVNTQRRATK